MRFLGLFLEDDVPDHSTLSRFRKELTQRRAYDRILKKVNHQLSAHKLIVKGGAKVDASLTQGPFSPKGATAYEMVIDREEDNRDHVGVGKGGILPYGEETAAARSGQPGPLGEKRRQERVPLQEAHGYRR